MNPALRYGGVAGFIFSGLLALYAIFYLGAYYTMDGLSQEEWWAVPTILLLIGWICVAWAGCVVLGTSISEQR